jgi:hypothetical protein
MMQQILQEIAAAQQGQQSPLGRATQINALSNPQMATPQSVAQQIRSRLGGNTGGSIGGLIARKLG